MGAWAMLNAKNRTSFLLLLQPHFCLSELKSFNLNVKCKLHTEFQSLKYNLKIGSIFRIR